MKKLIVFLSLILVSCNQEPEKSMLERCIDANIYKNDWISKKIEYFDNLNPNGPPDPKSPSTTARIRHHGKTKVAFLESLNGLEDEIDSCIEDKQNPLMWEDNWYDTYTIKMTPELELLHNQCELEVGDKYFVNLDYAVEICNSQGVY